MVKAKFSPVVPRGQQGPQYSRNVLGTSVADTLREAIGARGEPATIAEATRDVNANHYSVDYAEYSMNCQRCVVAYELQRRGYDVEALATYRGDMLPQVAYYDNSRGTWEGRWKGAFQGARTINVGMQGNTSSTERAVIGNLESNMQGFGTGSRGVVQVFWRGGGGHVFNVENDGGRIRYMDALTGKSVNISDYIHLAKTGSVNLVRTDNLRVSERAKNFVTKKRR